MSKLAEVGAFNDELPPNANRDVVLDGKHGSTRDVEDMKRMGKEQLFKVGPWFPCRETQPVDNAQRNFGFLSIFGFAMILMQTWQALLGSVINHRFAPPSSYLRP